MCQFWGHKLKSMEFLYYHQIPYSSAVIFLMYELKKNTEFDLQYCHAICILPCLGKSGKTKDLQVNKTRVQYIIIYLYFFLLRAIENLSK